MLSTFIMEAIFLSMNFPALRRAGTLFLIEIPTPRIPSWIDPSTQIHPQKNPRAASAKIITTPAKTKLDVWVCETVRPVVIQVHPVSKPPKGQNDSGEVAVASFVYLSQISQRTQPTMPA